MKTPLLIAIIATSVPVSGMCAAELPITAAVLPFAAQEEALEGQARNLTALTEAQLATAESLQLVERGELDKVLSEQEATLSGTVDATTAAKIGQLTGAKVLITGRCIPADGSTIIVAKAISTETGRVFATKQTLGAADHTNKGCEALADALAGLIQQHRADLVATVETHEQRLARLKGLLPAGAVMPTVHVEVAEQHLSRPVPDPAVQTEIQHTLQALGFTLVDDAAKAAWKISGEAFSERGSQRGNLITCRARVELKIQKAGSDRFQVDRQTDVALDLAEHIAAKSALEHAGLALADRLVSVISR